MNHKKKILIFVENYYPGYKAGGCLRSVYNLVNELEKDFDFLIVTKDRDKLDSEPYTGIVANEWNKVKNTNIFYASEVTIKFVFQIIKTMNFDVLYLNSLFNFRFSILPFLLHLLINGWREVILAPRGELFNGALYNKKLKKTTFLFLLKISLLYKKTTFQASNLLEKEEIKRVLGKSYRIKIASDIPSQFINDSIVKPIKNKGELKIIYLSRITPKKNLIGALKIINGLKGKITFDIYGYFDKHESNEYEKKCRNLINKLTGNVEVNIYDVVDYNKVVYTFSRYHIFLFPTYGENFGHVIYESLSSGTPVLCSLISPWNNLSDFNAGWNIDVNDYNGYRRILNELIEMDNENYLELVKGCKKYLQWKKKQENPVRDNYLLFTNPQ